MATHRVPFLNWTVKPDTSGLVYLEPYAVTATNDLANAYVLAFDTPGAARNGAFGQFEVPNNYASAGVVQLIYTSPVTTGDRFRMEMDYTAVSGSDAESLDPAAFGASTGVNAGVPSTANYRMTANLSLASLTAGDSVIFGIYRDGTQGSPDNDNVTGKIVVRGAVFQYSDV